MDENIYACSLVYALIPVEDDDMEALLAERGGLRVFESLSLVKAADEEAAQAEAVSQGEYMCEGGQRANIAGITCEMTFFGVRRVEQFDIASFLQSPGNDPTLSEVSFSEFLAADQASVERFAAGEEVALVASEV